MGRMGEFLARQRERAKETMAKTVCAVETVGAAAGWGYVNHAYGAGEVKLGAAADGSGGIAADAAAFIGLHALGFFGPRRYASHAHNLANGSGAAFAYRLGAEAGDKAAHGHKVSGDLVGWPQYQGDMTGHFLDEGNARFAPYAQQWAPSYAR